MRNNATLRHAAFFFNRPTQFPPLPRRGGTVRYSMDATFPPQGDLRTMPGRSLELARLLTSRTPLASPRVFALRPVFVRRRAFALQRAEVLGALLCFGAWLTCAGGAEPVGGKPAVIPASAV